MANDNDSIIFDAVRTVFTPAELALMAGTIATPEQIAAKAAGLTVTDKDGNPADPMPFTYALIVASNFHTYDVWKKIGLQVKRGEKAMMSVDLWRFTEKPNKAERQAAADEGKEAQPNPHYYKKRCALFFRSQVEKPQPVKVKTPEEIREYNRMLAEQRRARKAAAQPAPAPAPSAPAPAPVALVPAPVPVPVCDPVQLDFASLAAGIID